MEILHKISADIKAEVRAAQMLTGDPDLSRILIDRLGNTARSHTKDVVAVSDEAGHFESDTVTILHSFRQSIYEALPENVFHPPTLGGLGRTEEEIVDEIRLQRKKELEARQFFKPFEQEGPYLEMQALLLELMYEKKGSYNNLFFLFQQSWPVVGKLPFKMALSFLYILPILHQVRGNRSWTEKCLCFLLGFPVTIRENYEALLIPETTSYFEVGNTFLGADSHLSGAQYDGLFSWDIVIGPVPTEYIEEVLPQSGLEQIFLILTEHLIPAQLFFDYKIVTSPPERCGLGTKTESPIMGYTFYL